MSIKTYEGVPFYNEVNIDCDCGKHLHLDFTSVCQPDTICTCPSCGQGYLLKVEPTYDMDMITGDVTDLLDYSVTTSKLSSTSLEYALNVPTNISASFTTE